MSNSKMGAKEEYYNDKSYKMDDLSHAMNWVIGITVILAFVFGGAAFTSGATKLAGTLFGCGAGILVTEIVLKILFNVKSNTYSRKARTLREEREKREEQEKREQQEKNERICANEGHIFVEQPYENKNFGYKPELFTCLPLDFCVTERCSRCGAERKKIIDGFDKNRKLDLSPKMECPILYNDKVVGRYELSLSLDESYLMRAKKDIPSIEIKKGELFLVLNPQNRFYYNEKGLALMPEKEKEQTDKIYDDDEMPGLVELKKYIAFVDDETHEILTSTEISIDTEGDNEYFGVFKIGMLRVPDKGTLKVFCVIEG